MTLQIFANIIQIKKCPSYFETWSLKNNQLRRAKESLWTVIGPAPSWSHPKLPSRWNNHNVHINKLRFISRLFNIIKKYSKLSKQKLHGERNTFLHICLFTRTWTLYLLFIMSFIYCIPCYIKFNMHLEHCRKSNNTVVQFVNLNV